MNVGIHYTFLGYCIALAFIHFKWSNVAQIATDLDKTYGEFGLPNGQGLPPVDSKRKAKPIV